MLGGSLPTLVGLLAGLEFYVAKHQVVIGAGPKPL